MTPQVLEKLRARAAEHDTRDRQAAVDPTLRPTPTAPPRDLVGSGLAAPRLRF